MSPSARAALQLAAIVATMTLRAGPADADVDLRVQSQPASGPIEAFVTVTEGDKPVVDLSGGDFAVTLDGQAVHDVGFRPPVNQDPTERLSVVLVQADGRVMSSAVPFIQRMAPGDFAAIVRAKYWPGDFTPMLSQTAFTTIDGGAGSESLIAFLALSRSDQAALRYGSMVPHLAALDRGLRLFEDSLPQLPSGPKAIILVGNGRYIDSYPGMSLSDVVSRANSLGLPVFTISTSDMDDMPGAAAFMASLAEDTGGRFLGAVLSMSIDASYELIGSLLSSAYGLVIPAGAVTDCDLHTLRVTVRGESSDAPFVRCDATPDPFEFEEQVRVTPGSIVTSNAITIAGIDTSVAVSVAGGEYSLGCRGSFTSDPGFAQPGDLICVRHVASSLAFTSTETLLIVGGVSASFISSTGDVDVPPPQDPGGGGAAGIFDLLLAVGVLWLKGCARRMST